MVDSMKKNKSKSRRILNVVGIVLATPAILLFAAMILLYVPAIQNHATRKCSELVAQNSDFGLDLGSFRLHFPLNLTITDYTLYRESDTIVSGERLKVNIEVLPLFRGEVEVNYVSLSNTTIDSHVYSPESGRQEEPGGRGEECNGKPSGVCLQRGLLHLPGRQQKRASRGD